MSAPWTGFSTRHISFGLISAVVGAGAYVCTTFATVKYVDTKHESVVQTMRDQADRLDRIENKIDRLTEMLIDNHKGNK